MKKILLYFPRFVDAHFVKDVFLFPNFICELLHGHLTIICSNKPSNSDSYSNVSFKRLRKNPFLAFFSALKNFKNTDILILFHYRWRNLFLSFFYKLINPNGFVYIKGDMSSEESRKVSRLVLSKNLGFRYKTLSCIYKFASKYVDLLTVETTAAYQEILKVSGILNLKKVKLVPNGLDDAYDFNLPKEKIIINVARIGTHQKNTELLLSVLSDLQLSDWSFFFIGEIEGGFHKEIDAFYTENPHLCKNVFFLGNISEPSELYSLFQRSSIFCLSSRYESYGLVLNEAALYNNYIITTDVGGAKDLLELHGVKGAIANDVKQFLSELEIAMRSYPLVINNKLSHLNIKHIVKEITAEIEESCAYENPTYRC